MTKIAIKVVFSMLLICPALGTNAATFEVFDMREPEEGSLACLLRFEITEHQIVDIFSVKAAGKPLIIIDHNTKNSEFYEDKYGQYIDITIYFSDGDKRSYLGGTNNYWALPVADIDRKIIEKISQQKSWKIRVANDPPVEINDTVTPQQLKKFLDCMEGAGSETVQ